MTESTTRRVLRIWFRAQIVLLCAAVLAAGVQIAAARTEATAHSVPAAAQSDTPVPAMRAPDKLPGSDLWEYAALLPAPIGNTVSLYNSIKQISRQDVEEWLGKVHKIFR